jgi:hypothetical protein
VTRTVLAAIGAVLAPIAASAVEPQPLASYDVKLDETSVSGISSGAYMAVQFAVAHSSLVVGVGALAGGPYACAQGSVRTALGPCMIGPPPDVGALRALAERAAAAGLVDDLGLLARQRVWLLHGYNDGVVKKPVVDALRAFYAAAGVAPGSVHYRDDLPAAHAHVTDSSGQACSRTGGAFVNRCDGADAAGAILQFAHGVLRDRNPTGRLSGAVLPFRQSEFHADPESIGLDETGYVYVPASCAAGERCRVHVAFHGCLQNARTVGDGYYARAGYNEWADANRLVVLYPQTIASGKARNPLGRIPYNPNGCWDWWGYTGDAYARKDGPQIAAVERMLRRLAGRYTGWTSPPANAAPAPSLAAIDASSTSVALAWSAPPGARSFSLERASDPSCSRFSRVASLPATSVGFSDGGLAPGTRHCWRLAVVREDGSAAVTAPVERTTRRARPECDPYVRSVSQHWSEGRTRLRWLGTYARGSGDHVGDVGPGALFEQVLLLRTGPDHFVVGKVCE